MFQVSDTFYKLGFNEMRRKLDNDGKGRLDVRIGWGETDGYSVEKPSRGAARCTPTRRRTNRVDLRPHPGCASLLMEAGRRTGSAVDPLEPGGKVLEVRADFLAHACAEIKGAIHNNVD